VWQVQPSVRFDADGFLALSLEHGNDLICEVPFAAAVDTTDPDQQAVLRRYQLSFGKDFRYGLIHINHRCVLVIGMEEMNSMESSPFRLPPETWVFSRANAHTSDTNIHRG
jgi:hypothetical protein